MAKKVEEKGKEQEEKGEDLDPCLVKLTNANGDSVMAHPLQVKAWEKEGYTEVKE